MKITASLLKSRALEEGFDLAGIASTGASESWPHLESWLDAGMHGTMDYLDRHRELRRDPSQLLPGCRSILAVAMSYHQESPEEPRPGYCRISSYASGRDYHRVMKKKLIRLGRSLKGSDADIQWRAVVDTAPILEREWAARAGLGWIGRNTMLINRKFGSEIFLGLLLLSLDLEPDEAAREHCGTCTACLDACPTGAFVRERVLDARRCIAYLTIEHRSDIEEVFAPAIPPDLAGCDRCNAVCPFNRKAPSGLHPEFSPAEHRRNPEIRELGTLDEQGWKDWRRGSALNRVSWEQFRRNLRVLSENGNF